MARMMGHVDDFRLFQASRVAVCRQSFHRDAVVPEDVGLAAGDRVFVRNADDAKRHGNAGLHQHGGTRLAQAAVDRVFLDRDDGPALAAGARGRRRRRAA